MKKFLAVVAVMTGFIIMAGKALAANPETLILRVTPGVTRDVLLSSNLYDFGSVNLGASTVTVSAITVSHGPLSNVASSYALRTTGSANWTPDTAAGTNAFNLRALFNATQPNPADFLANDDVDDDTIVPGDTADNAAVYTISGAYNGQSVAVGGNRDLWFMLNMPTISGSSAQQNISVTVTAVP